MIIGNCVLAGVPIRRVVAAPGLSTGNAVAQMNPGTTDGEALDAATLGHGLEGHALQLFTYLGLAVTPECHGRRLASGRGRDSAHSSCSMGSDTRNVVLPGSDVSVTSPLCLLTTIP